MRPLDASDSSLFLNLMLGDLIQAIGKSSFFSDTTKLHLFSNF